MQAGDRAAVHDAMGNLHAGTVVDDAVRGAWAAFKESAATGAWFMMAPHATRKDAVTLVSTGEGGYCDVAAALAARPSEISFVVCACTAGGQRKAFFLTNVGPGVSPLKRGKVSLQKNGEAVEAFGRGCCVWLGGIRAIARGAL